MVAWWFVLMSFLAVVARILGQPTTEGFISIDCGFDKSSSYKDETTGLAYDSDNGFIDSGVNYKIDLEVSTQLKTLRSFPKGARNCYNFTTFKPGTKLLIRASFLYGNYDGQNSVKSSNGLSFDLWLGTKFWRTVTLGEVDDVFTTEIITVIATKYLWVCLVNTGHGTPFISSLELRLLDSKLYPAASESQPLILLKRFDTGSSSADSTRYPDDQYDRIWEPYTETLAERYLPYFTERQNINTKESISNLADDVFEVPSYVMQTAMTPTDNTYNLSLSWDKETYDTDIYREIYYFMHLADFQDKLTRVFRTYVNIDLVNENFSPPYLRDSHLFSNRPPPPKEATYQITLQKTNDSLLPPLLNALEVYQVTAFSEVATDSSDVDAMMSIKNQYHVKKNWMGDPCAPQDYTWDGVNCNNYSNSGTPRVISLNLSSSGLTGEIPSSLEKLSAITSLDLSYNSLAGKLPDFLAELPSLQLLKLTGNHLSGSIPPALWSKSVDGRLTLSVDGNPSLSTNMSSSGQNHCRNWGSCGRKKKIIVSLSIVSVVIVVGLMLCVWRLGSRKRTSLIVLEYQEYTSKELEKITKNFGQVLGSGGFGTVYHGTLENGTQVAVKKLFEKSEQATRGFLSEVQILTRTHHASLVQLVGYGRDGENLALVYEYMAEGSLQDHLSGKEANARSLNWVERLRIALGAAQGLDYLHVGCTLPVVHRDVKTSNILLNEKLEAKVADFGLSKAFCSSTQTHLTMEMIGGTPGYVDPEYNTTRVLSRESDVYSFGVVLFELITGLPALRENAEAEHIVPWVELKLKSGDVAEIVDSSLQEYCIESMIKVVELAKKCTENTRIKRPSMSDVVADLKESLKLETAHESFQVECSEAPPLQEE